MEKKSQTMDPRHAMYRLTKNAEKGFELITNHRAPVYDLKVDEIAGSYDRFQEGRYYEALTTMFNAGVYRGFRMAKNDAKRKQKSGS